MNNIFVGIVINFNTFIHKFSNMNIEWETESLWASLAALCGARLRTSKPAAGGAPGTAVVFEPRAPAAGAESCVCG